ncbi:MAG: TetR/AcrR family transcriptional regulator [Erythrobacter sp.]|uniref:TetR/AcrR family transcriptional regulator n=1 Tax=Erythrobacter sp. TaxID=1042 RepID=UPI0025E60B67|nr:TetR/AcrR family transcriptional regulator [Erythrobacter sp.]MCL9998767.1 TetR/AcrR family transcriptional regulator [Erythrobacter sp.]
MSRREEAKTFNRARICAAAEAIIRGEGMDKLTMRRLAEVAGVSLRTPYNLFGSKTDVLIALLDEAGFEFAPRQTGESGASAIAHLFGGLGRIAAFFASDEAYYRGIYAAIMASDHPEVRSTGVGRAVVSAQALVAEAVAHGELRADTDAASLGRHLAIALLAVLGMWGSGFFSNRESIAQVRRAWLAVLLQHCSDAARPSLASAYRDLCTAEIDQ